MLSPHIFTLNDLLKFIGIFAGSTLIALILTHYMIRQFGKWQIIATTNHRSMHSDPVPVGGGWAIIPLTLIAGLFFFWPINDALTGAILSGTLTLACLSWIDDRRHLPRFFRLAVQAAAIILVLIVTPDQQTVFSNGWPLWADRLLTALCWLWFVNLFNFMDGIDGLAGIETLFICSGFVIIGLTIGLEMPILLVVTVLAGTTAGFLWWNWHPAKIFLGDVGSISIGFLVGWLLIQLAISGYLVAAFLLPAYFITDASVTLLKRVRNGEPFWEPHKTHYYQRATTRLGSHSQTLWRIIPANIALLVLAITSLDHPVISALCGIVVVVSLLFLLQRYAAK